MTPQQFRAWRAHLRMSRKEVAEALGLSLGTIENYENGIRRDGATVVIPKAVSLACAAISHGYRTYSGPPDA